MTTDKYYRVQKAAPGIHEFLTGALSLAAAQAHLNSIAANMVANGYMKTDRNSIRKLPVVILAKDMRTVALAVVECGPEDIIETKREAVHTPYNVQTYDLSEDSDTRELEISAETPVDGLFDMRDGVDDYADAAESAGAA